MAVKTCQILWCFSFVEVDPQAFSSRGAAHLAGPTAFGKRCVPTVFRNNRFPQRLALGHLQSGAARASSSHCEVMGCPAFLPDQRGALPLLPRLPSRPVCCSERGSGQGGGSDGRESHTELSSFNAQKAGNVYLGSATQGPHPRKG